MTERNDISDLLAFISREGDWRERLQDVVAEHLMPALEEFEDQTSRWVDLHWHSGRHAPVFTVSLEITISNDAGVLGRICTLIGEQKANISDLRFTDRKPDFFRLIIDVDLRDVEHLHLIMTALEAETDVAQISRHRDLTRRP